MSLWKIRPKCSPTHFLSKLIHNLDFGKSSPKRGELCPLGGMFTPSVNPRGEHSLHTVYVEEWRGEQSLSHPWGTTSSFGGSKFAPRGEVKNGPLVSQCLKQDGFTRRARKSKFTRVLSIKFLALIAHIFCWTSYTLKFISLGWIRFEIKTSGKCNLQLWIRIQKPVETYYWKAMCLNLCPTLPNVFIL
jgi:hypothetical protein